MATSDYTDNLRVSNGEGWYSSFSLSNGLDGIPPWSGLPAWSPGASYDGSSACSYQGDLYVAAPGLNPASWVSASYFEYDLDITGLSRWLQVGYADQWTQVPYDLTGAVVGFAIRATDQSASVFAEYADLTASSDDGTGAVAITNATAGGVALAIPPARTQSVASGLYLYEVTVTYPDGRRERARYGLLTVDQRAS